MYIAEIISCRNNNYWYRNSIGEFFNIYNNSSYVNGLNISEVKISDYMSRNIEITDKTKYKILISKVKSLDLSDIKIHSERSLKLKQLRCT